MKKASVIDRVFAENDSVVIIDKDHIYYDRRGIIERLGSAGDDVVYLHTRLDGVNTLITFRTFQVQKDSGPNN